MGTFLRPAEDFGGALAGCWAVRFGRRTLVAELSVRAALARAGAAFAAEAGVPTSAGSFSRSATLRTGVGRSTSSAARIDGEAMTGIWPDPSERGMCGVLGIGRTGHSVLATNPAAAQATTMGIQMQSGTLRPNSEATRLM
jgi:hypothetical protein